MKVAKPKNRKLPSRPPPTPSSEETDDTSMSSSVLCSEVSDQTSLEESDTVPRSEYNELLQKYEETCRELSQKKTYIVALEKMLDMERQKADAQLQVKSKNKGHARRHSSKANFNAIFSLKDKEKEKEKEMQFDRIEQEKEQYQTNVQRQEEERKKESDCRLAHCSSDKKKEHRLKILEEIINTEQDYVETLRILVLCRSKLRTQNVLFEEELGYIFSNIDEIYELHRSTCDVLIGCLDSAGEENCWNASVGEVLLNLADSLSVYTVYINNEVLQTPTVCACARRKAFIKLLYNEIPRFNNKALLIASLRSCLIAPIQRLCKYPLLVRELLSVTDKSHADIKTLKAALTKLQEAAMAVNEEKKAAEQQTKMKEIDEALVDRKGFELHKEGRIFVMEGALLKISNGITQERQFYLFNDVLIYGRASMMKAGRIHMRGKILLGRLVINNLPDSSTIQNGFEIVRLDHKKKRYIICSKLADSKGAANKKMWKDAIEQQALIQRLNYEANPPEEEDVWQPYNMPGNDILKKTCRTLRPKTLWK